jgi:hypothetical protein
MAKNAWMRPNGSISRNPGKPHKVKSSGPCPILSCTRCHWSGRPPETKRPLCPLCTWPIGNWGSPHVTPSDARWNKLYKQFGGRK